MAKVHRISKEQTAPEKKKIPQVSDEAMQKLAELMNDTPTVLTLNGTQWEITGLKPAVQWLICEKVCEIVKEEKATCEGYEDVLKLMARSLPLTAHCLTLAMLNDKDRIFDDYGKKKYSEEFQQTYELLLWGDFKIRDWGMLLFEVMQKIDVSFFSQSISLLKTARQTTLQRKMTTAEAES